MSDDDAPTFWNGEPCDAARTEVEVPQWDPERHAPLAWWRDLAGTYRPAVVVKYGDQVFVLDDEDGKGWGKVTEGRGSPRVSHSELPVEDIAADHVGEIMFDSRAEPEEDCLLCNVAVELGCWKAFGIEDPFAPDEDTDR